MSATYALIRFKSTGNVYFGCYEGTSDILNPVICTPEECYDEKVDCYCSISYCRDAVMERDWIFPDDVADLDAIEIYSDYGGGFFWHGYGSESLRLIKNFLNPWEDCPRTIMDGKPDWVEEFWRSVEE